jgi:hypothetical protein
MSSQLESLPYESEGGDGDNENKNYRNIFCLYGFNIELQKIEISVWVRI